MAVIQDFKATTLRAFITEQVAPGSTIYTDGLKQFTGLPAAGFQHVQRTQPSAEDLRKGAKSVVPLADRAIGNLQQWLVGTHHGVSRGQLQVYLDEFVFRHNRRKQPLGRLSASDTARPGDRARPDPIWAYPGGSGRGRSCDIIATCWGVLKQPDKQDACRVREVDYAASTYS